MSNLRHYSDLLHHLLSVAENTLMRAGQEIELNKEKWMQYKTISAIMKLK